MRFVNEEYPLKVCVVAAFDHNWRVVFLELLNIDDYDLRLAKGVVLMLIVLQHSH